MKKRPCHSVCCIIFILPLFFSIVNAQTKIPPQSPEQSNRVGGTVQDAKGNPLSGVSVTVKSTGMGTTTDSSGRFRLTVPSPQSVLVFSLVSYENKEETAGRKQKMLITLNESANSMNDVVVIGYGTAKKRDVAGSITSISAKQLEERHPVSLGDALQGMAAQAITLYSSSMGYCRIIWTG